MAADARARRLVEVAARAADNLKGGSILALDVSSRLPLTDAFLLVSGTTERQVAGIVDAVEETLARRGAHARRREGLGAARWVLLDFGDAVVHVQHVEDREFYGLDRLWKDCPVIDLPGIGDGEDIAQTDVA
jgi:ribosome-associated protein